MKIHIISEPEYLVAVEVKLNRRGILTPRRKDTPLYRRPWRVVPVPRGKEME